MKYSSVGRKAVIINQSNNNQRHYHPYESFNAILDILQTLTPENVRGVYLSIPHLVDTLDHYSLYGSSIRKINSMH
jgi:hypothetical protein